MPERDLGHKHLGKGDSGVSVSTSIPVTFIITF